MKKTTGIVLALALAGIAGLLFWLAPGDGGSSSASGPFAASGGSDATAPHQAPVSFSTGVEGLPSSLQGTEVDGELEVDAGGHLKITGGVRRLFDYFLSAVGEEPLETLIARIRAYIRHKLQGQATAAAEAEHLLDSYIAYKHGLEAIPQAQVQPGGNIDIDTVRRQMQQVQALRTQFFTPEAITAFFGDEDAYDRYTLARLEVMQNKGLSPTQRAQQLAALEGQLPSAMQESLKAINQVQNLDALTAEWKQRGGSPAELRQIRENLVGAEATDRLETLDRERAGWDQRMNTWYAERAAVLANRNLSEQDRQHQLAELRDSRFNETERLRVEALERIHDSGEVVGR